MKFQTSVIVYNRKAYVFTLLDTPYIYIRSEPVYITNLETSALANALEKVLQAGNPRVLVDEPDSLNKAEKLTVKYTGAKSYRRLVKNSIFYSTLWTDQKISIDMSILGTHWEHDYKRHRELPADTDMETIAKIIIDDALSHPEVLNPPVITPKSREKLNPKQGE